VIRAIPCVLVAATAAACASAASTPRAPRAVLRVACAPQDALLALKADAQAHGWRVAGEGLDTLLVDFGVATARLPIDDVPRDTEVHATALFKFDAAPGGAAVTAWNDPIYWHPDRRTWMRAPDDLAPCDALLAECFPPRRAAASAAR